jgi:hypothetical protein
MEVMHTNYLVAHYFLRKLVFLIIIVPQIGAWQVMKMMATVHDALRYGDIMHVITYHPNVPTTFVGHQIFMVNGKHILRVPVLLVDAEVVKFCQCINKHNYFLD